MDTQMLIGSRFEAGTETAEQVLNPRSGKLIEAVPEASTAQIDAAVAAAEAAFALACGLCGRRVGGDSGSYAYHSAVGRGGGEDGAERGERPR